MRKAKHAILFWAAVFFSLTANAETWLCIPEKGAMVSAKGSELNSQLAETDRKYLLTQEGGKWIVKFVGSPGVWLDTCHSEWMCERGGGKFGGFFMRDNDNVFTAGYLIREKEDERAFLTVIGRCSKIEV